MTEHDDERARQVHRLHEQQAQAVRRQAEKRDRAWLVTVLQQQRRNRRITDQE